MSTEPQPGGEATAPLPVLNPEERRVLGVLVEKAKTTPDAYPLSLNALVTGCNQKSNRDPVLNLAEVDVEEVLIALGRQRLVINITGGRVERWRHNLYEAWHLGKVELAVLGELLLRGPQTEGELRSRASRMEPIEDLDRLRALLKPLAERGLVVYLSPEGRRGTMLTHGFHAPEEVQQLRAAHKGEAGGSPGAEPRPAPAPAHSAASVQTVADATLVERLAGLEERLAQACDGIAELRGRLARLEQQARPGHDPSPPA